MTTSINLVSPENEDKRKFTGKTALFISVGLVIVILGAYGVISIFGRKYSSEQKNLEAQIQDEKTKISGPAYASVADFQERLNLLEKIIADHPYWSDYVKDFSRYLLPDVRLSSFSGSLGEGKISIKGVAPSYEALSRQIILLQKFPGAKSVEFKDSSAADQGGIDFGLEITVNGEAFKKDLSKIDQE